MRSEQCQETPTGVSRRAALMISAAPLLVAALITLGLWVRAGSFGALVRFAQGESVFVDGPVRDLGRVAPKEKVKVQFVLKNLVFQDINVIGSQASCTCMLLGNELPVTIAGGGSKPIGIVVTPPEKPGEFSYPLELYTDSPSWPRVKVRVKGVVTRS